MIYMPAVLCVLLHKRSNFVGAPWFCLVLVASMVSLFGGCMYDQWMEGDWICFWSLFFLSAACDFSFLNKPGGMFYKVQGKKTSNWLPVFNQPMLYKGLEEDKEHRQQGGWRRSEKRGKRTPKLKGHCFLLITLCQAYMWLPWTYCHPVFSLEMNRTESGHGKCRAQPETGCVSKNGWLQLLQPLDCILKVDWQSVPGTKGHFLVPAHSQLWLGAICLGRILPWRMRAFYLDNFAEKSRIFVLTS